MTPVQFERETRSKLFELGWEAVLTPSSGDRGADIIATCGDEKLVVQCKRYSQRSLVGYHAIQEVVHAREFYKATHGALVYSGRLSHRSHEDAAVLRVFIIRLDDLDHNCLLDRSAKGRILRTRKQCTATLERAAQWDIYKIKRANHLTSVVRWNIAKAAIALLVIVASYWLWSDHKFFALGGLFLSMLVLREIGPTAPRVPNGNQPSDEDRQNALRFLTEFEGC